MSVIALYTWNRSLVEGGRGRISSESFPCFVEDNMLSTGSKFVFTPQLHFCLLFPSIFRVMFKASRLSATCSSLTASTEARLGVFDHGYGI